MQLKSVNWLGSVGALALTLVSALVLALLAPTSVLAQTDPRSPDRAEIPQTVLPPVSAVELRETAEQIKANQDLSEEVRTSTSQALEQAALRLEEGARLEEARAGFVAELEQSRRTLTQLREETEALKTVIATTPPAESPDIMVGEAAMFETEQRLLSKESELRALQAEIDGYRTQIQQIGTRLTAAPQALNEARTQLGEITTSLSTIGAISDDPIAQARQEILRARAQYRRAQIAALEAEIAGLPVRQEILTARRSLAETRARRLTEEVLALQTLTGQRKIVEARQQVAKTETLTAQLNDVHPIIEVLGRENLRLAKSIESLAAQEVTTSRKLAVVRGQSENVLNDLTAARQLVEIGRLDREAGATLRRLGNQLEPTPRLRADLRETQSRLSDVTRQRVVAQERQRGLPVGVIDTEQVLQQARRDMPSLPDLDQDARAAVSEMMDLRRDLLSRVVASATERIDAVAALQTAQTDLINQTSELENLLDENLLWVPSVPPVWAEITDFAWPRKVILGAIELAAPQRLLVAMRTLLNEGRSYWLVVLLSLIGIGATYRMRPSLWSDIEERGEKVGRVRQDSVWQTPAVIGAGLLMALPWPLLFGLIAFLFARGPGTDLIVPGLARGFAFLSVFSLILLTWQVWDREGSLFERHFKMPQRLRRSVRKNLRWFIPLVGVTSTLLAITTDMRSVNIYEGFSLLVFVISALAVAYFAYRVLLRGQKQSAADMAQPTLYSRYRRPLGLFLCGLPFVAAILAMSGYYASADELLWRLFLTGYIVLIVYVIYGVVRRAITVSQRQIKYRQAVERREAQLRARKEQMEAEERGEDPPAPPPIDTSEIDVSAMSRQSAQLLRVATAIGLAVLLWMNWSSLLPALSFFDGFEIWSYKTGDLTEAGDAMTRAVTLWTVLQVLAIGTLTVIAARNLPGFLEILVLNRFQVDAGARYAIVTIIGYIIVAIGIVLVFRRLGLRGDQLKWVAGGLSLGIGIGLQKIVANFVSGLILLFERPIRIGDYVTIGDKAGTVTRIKIRATTLMDLDNREILIPNENLISQDVTNWTLSNAVTRLTCTVGIAYGSDTDKARDIMMEVLKSNSKVLDNPPPAVLFTGFGDSSLDFELRVHLRNFDDRWPVKHQIHTDVNKALAAAGFEIPFPQRDLNIRGQDGPIEINAPARPSKTPSKKKS